MRAGPTAVFGLIAAVIGGVCVLAVGKAAGWLDSTTNRTVFVERGEVAQPVRNGPRITGAAAKPLSGNGFNPARIYANRASGVVTIYAVYGSPNSEAAEAAQGSGFVVSKDGYVLTNSHVITTAGEGATGDKVTAADQVFVEFQDRDRVPAEVVGWDIFDDVGLLKVKPSSHSLSPVPLGDSARVSVGEPVAAIGSPFGNENSLAVGVVSATERSIDSLTSAYNLVDAIQIDAPINHGNSGGPLFDARGRVIGINAQIRSQSGNAEGVGFAVPIDSAKRSMQQLIATGKVAYAYVGIETEDLTPSLARRFGYPVGSGAVVTTVHSDTPGAAAGLRGGNKKERALGTIFTVGGDLIVAIDGQPVSSAEDVVRVVTERLNPGQTARFTIYRGTSRRTVPVKLSVRPANPE
jgi:S1-C subfamily serine protease